MAPLSALFPNFPSFFHDLALSLHKISCTRQSERIFSFAQALAGDDEEKMTKMKEAFEKGFKEATKTWGKKLPDISQNTRDAVLKKFDDYFAGKNS